MENYKQYKMNMFNYLRGQISKLEVDSPIKNIKRLSAGEEIYLEQIVNYIEVEGGYNVLKQKLFKDISENYMVDSPFIQQLVILLRKNLQTKIIDTMDTERRTISIIEDLICHCGPIMNEAFNDRLFCQALQGCILFMYKLKNILKANQNIIRATGIFMYLHQKFQTQPRYVYHQFYENLKKQNIPFPTTSLIKQVKLRKISQQEKDQLLNLQQILLDCEQTAKNAQQMIKNDIKKIDTNYVRLLKAKVKKLYTISTTPETQFSPFQKQKISQVYKKIRSQLKQIQKINQNNAKQKALQKQKEYLQQKMTGSPKKIEKQIPKVAIIQKSPIKITQIVVQHKKQDLIKQQPIQLSNKKKSSKQEVSIFQRDLLDIQINKQYPKSPKKKQEQINQVQMIDQKMITPVKKQKSKQTQSQKLLDLDQDYSTPNSLKQLNFKQLYSQNQISPELKDLDLIGNSSKKSKQSIKSDDEEEAQFGEYK